MNLTGKLNGILGSLEKNAEVLGAGIQAWNKKDLLINEIGLVLQGHVHMPDFAAFGANLPNEPGFQGGVGAAIAGWILEAANIDPRLNKIGSIAKKAGTGMAVFAAAENLLGYATNTKLASGESSYTQMSQSTQQNIQAAPTTQQAALMYY